MVNGKQIPVSEIEKYLKIAPKSINVSDQPGKFLITAGTQLADIDLMSELILHFPDGSESRIQSLPLRIRIHDEYIDVNSRNGPIIDVTNTGSVSLDFAIKNHSGFITAPQYPITLNIYDDID